VGCPLSLPLLPWQAFLGRFSTLVAQQQSPVWWHTVLLGVGARAPVTASLQVPLAGFSRLGGWVVAHDSGVWGSSKMVRGEAVGRPRFGFGSY